MKHVIKLFSVLLLVSSAVGVNTLEAQTPPQDPGIHLFDEGFYFVPAHVGELDCKPTTLGTKANERREIK